MAVSVSVSVSVPDARVLAISLEGDITRPLHRNESDRKGELRRVEEESDKKRERAGEREED
jgi:hypothetical protein